MTTHAPSEANVPVVLYDGTCGLCDRSVRFILDRDPAGRFRFAALQSDVAAELLAASKPVGASTLDGVDSVVLVENGRAYVRSEAALRIAAELGGGWPLLAALRLVPRLIRDAVYDFIARHRRRFFTPPTCAIPTADERARFLDLAEGPAAA